MKAKPLAEKVYGALLERIMSGSWRPGELLDRRGVAKELGVSVAPVGEAMLRLQEDGFIVTLPRKGTMLRPCDLRRLYENLVLREAIECQAARMALPRLREAAPRLGVLAAEADQAADAERCEFDAAFHRELVGLAEVGVLLGQFERLRLQVLFDELRLLDSPGGVGDPHCQLLQDLLAAASPEAAAERMRSHLRHGRESLFKRFENTGR